MKIISPDDLIPINLFESDFPILVNLIYAQKDHPDNHFGQLYHPKTFLLWLHKDLARIILRASQMGSELFGWTLDLLDGLRPVEAQREMSKFSIPWQMLARPGQGGHPRAMAVDIFPRDHDGNKLEMGTAFDQFVENYGQDINYADRSITDFGKSLKDNLEIWQNRGKLTYLMLEAARQFDHEILPLPHEWWDYRLPKELSDQYAPLKESDLYPFQRLISPDIEQCQKIKKEVIPEEIKNNIKAIYETLS